MDSKLNGWQRVLLLLVLLTAGCQARLGVDVDVAGDGSGTLAVTLSADHALQTRAAEAGVDPLSELAAAGRDLAASRRWRVRDDRGEDGGRTVRLSTEFASPAELESLAADLADGLAGPELVPLEGLRLELTDEELRFSATAGLVPTDAVTELGVQPQQAVTILEDTEVLMYELRVRLAGELVRANADDGHEPGAVDPRLTWRVAPGEQVSAVAVSLRPGLPWWALAGAAAAAAVVLLAAATVALTAWRRRRS